MSKVLRIARREYKATIRTKGFIIGLLLAPVLMGGSTIAFALLKDRVDTKDKRLVVVDHTGQVAPALLAAAEEHNAKQVHDPKSGKKVQPAYLLESWDAHEKEPASLRLELSDRIRRGELHAFLEIGKGVVHPRENTESAWLRYYARNPALDELRRWVSSRVNAELRQLRLADARVDAASVPDLFHWIGAEGLGLVSVDETGTIKKAERRSEVEALLVPIVLPVLLFLMLLMSALPLLGAVVEEKVQRIAEVLLGSVTPFQFMMGKLLGGVCVSLTAATVYVVGGVLLVNHMDLGQFIPYAVIPWFLAYLILAIFMFGALFAALGASCSEQAEVQAITMPAILPVLIPMFVLIPVAQHPLSAFSTGMSLFPPFTPMMMTLRMATPGGVPSWQPWVGLLGIVLFTLLCVWAGSRIFRIGILLQGTPFKLGNLARWIFRG